MRVLLAEDNAEDRKPVWQALRAGGYEVDVACDADEAMRLAGRHPYRALILSGGIPSEGGTGTVRRLRRQGVTAPVVLLTDAQDREAGVEGLDAGADDFLVKPVAVTELLARLRAVLRRCRPNGVEVFRLADLEVDPVARAMTRNGRRVELTNREFRVLEVLMLAYPQPVSKAAILERVWGRRSEPRTNVVNVHMAHLRRKINRPGLPPLLHTLRGVGFALFRGPA